MAASGLDLEKGASQVLCLAETVAFTRDAEAAIGRGGKQVLRARARPRVRARARPWRSRFGFGFG